jgi:hypothetical protein
MTAVIGSLRADLSASIAQFQSDLGQAARSLKNFSKEAKAIGREIEEVGRGMSIALTLPLVALGAEAVKRSTDAKQAMASLQATIASTGNASGKTAEQLAATSKELRNMSTFQDDDILRGVTSNLLRFGNVQGEVFDRAQKSIVNLSAALGGDLQSNTIKVGRALNDPIKGIASLTRIGIQFTDAQKAQIKALVQSGEGFKAQAIILGELETKFGGAAKALRDATPGAELKNTWDDFAETIGDDLVPALQDLASMLSGVLKWFNQLPAPVQKLVVGIAAVAAVIGPLLAGFGFFLKLGGQIAGLLGTLFTWIASLEAITLGWVAAIVAVGVALVIFSKSVGDIIHGNFAKAWADAKDTAKNIAGTVKDLWNSFTTPQAARGPAGGAAGGPAGRPPKAVFNQDNEAELKKAAEAQKTLLTDIIAMQNKIANGLGDTVLPKATTQANQLNQQIDAFVKKAKDAGVNTDKFAGTIDGLRGKIEQLKQAGLAKEAKAFSESVDTAQLAVDKFARGGLPPLQERLENVDDQFKALHDKIQNDIEANAALASSNADAADAMERLQRILGDLGKAHEAATKAAIAQVAAEQKLAELASQRNQLETSNAIQDLTQAQGKGGPLGSAQADLQNTSRALAAQAIEAQQKLVELEVKRAELVEQNQNGENDRAIENLNAEIALQQQLTDLVQNTSAVQLEAARRVDEAFSQFADDLSGQLADMLENWNGSLTDLASTFRKLAEQLFIKPGTDALSSGISGSLKGLLGGGGAGGSGAGGGAGSGLSGLFDSFAGLFASGGSLNPGEWGIAGENGPEPIFGGAHGLSVMSNPDAQNAAQGGRRAGVSQTFNITTPDANSFRASQRQIARQAKQNLGV